MIRLLEKYGHLIIGVIVTLVVLLTWLPQSNWGPQQQRFFNATASGIAFLYWMRDLTRLYEVSKRRTRRVSSAVAGVIFSGFYGSLEVAFHADGDPTKRIIIVAITMGWLVGALAWHPDDDWEIPEPKVYPWERWLVRRRTQR